MRDDNGFSTFFGVFCYVLQVGSGVKVVGVSDFELLPNAFLVK